MEQGKQLTVSIKADSIDETGTLKEEEKEAVDKINEKIGKKKDYQ